MKFIRWFFGFLLVLIILILGIAYALPNAYSVSRSLVIHAPPEKIYPLVAAPKQWKNWSVWNQRDAAMHMQFSGPESGTGAAWEWQSRSQGNGGMKFTYAITNRQLEYELHFEGMGKPSTGAFMLEGVDDGTKITWNMHGSSEGSLMTKLFAPFMDKMVGPDFQAGLDNLKKLAEQK
ncbi:MAG: SRPBCC family protein [Burkholderiales bacterium]|nr:SRPBCC family protein [Burkholderiales bacterium]